MARASEWQRYRLLQDLIAQAIEDDMCGQLPEELTDITLAISPDLGEVYAGVDGASPFEDGDEAFDGWYIERADSYDGAIAIADNYFDLR